MAILKPKESDWQRDLETDTWTGRPNKMDYELTDEMFEAFGTGKLKVERVEDKPREFRVAYDSMQINNAMREIQFSWKGIIVGRLSYKDTYLGPHDVLTVQDITGFVPFKLIT